MNTLIKTQKGDMLYDLQSTTPSYKKVLILTPYNANKACLPGFMRELENNQPNIYRKIKKSSIAQGNSFFTLSNIPNIYISAMMCQRFDNKNLLTDLGSLKECLKQGIHYAKDIEAEIHMPRFIYTRSWVAIDNIVQEAFNNARTALTIWEKEQ